MGTERTEDQSNSVLDESKQYHQPPTKERDQEKGKQPQWLQLCPSLTRTSWESASSLAKPVPLAQLSLAATPDSLSRPVPMTRNSSPQPTPSPPPDAVSSPWTSPTEPAERDSIASVSRTPRTTDVPTDSCWSPPQDLASTFPVLSCSRRLSTSTPRTEARPSSTA